MRQPFDDQPKHRGGETWGPREIIAVCIILGSFLYAFVALITDHPGAEVPAWVAGIIGGIALYLYRNGGHAGGA